MNNQLMANLMVQESNSLLKGAKRYIFMKRKLVYIIILIASFNITVFAQERIKAGDSCPNFKLTTLDGKTINPQDLKGKVLYINFMATWCGPCRKELPSVESDIWKSIKHSDFVMVVVGRQHTEAEMAEFLKTQGYTFPVAADTNRAVFDLFAEANIPRNVIVDKTGKVIYNEHGFEPEPFAKMVELIKENLKKK